MYGLFSAGKTDAAIIRSSKAAPVLDSIATRYQEGVDIKIPPSIFEHHKKSSADDFVLVKTELREVWLFRVHEGRRINLVVAPWPTIDRAEYTEHTKRNMDWRNMGHGQRVTSFLPQLSSLMSNYSSSPIRPPFT